MIKLDFAFSSNIIDQKEGKNTVNKSFQIPRMYFILFLLFSGFPRAENLN